MPEVADLLRAGTEQITSEAPAELPDQRNVDTDIPPATWHLFWSPFASEASAEGFAARIERLTGVVTRVTEQTEGGYVVGFAYRDVDERRMYLDLIEAGTGLDLREVRP